MEGQMEEKAKLPDGVLNIDIELALEERIALEEARGNLQDAVSFLKMLGSLYPDNELAKTRLDVLSAELRTRRENDLTGRFNLAGLMSSAVWEKLKGFFTGGPHLYISRGYAWGADEGESPDQEAAQGDGIDRFQVGQEILFSIKSPPSGHLVALRYDPEGNADLLFPLYADQDTYMDDQDQKFIPFHASGPLGLQGVRTFVTSRELLSPVRVDSAPAEEVQQVIAEFLEQLSELSPGELFIKDYQFKVVAR